jgi:hypothetical protein
VIIRALAPLITLVLPLSAATAQQQQVTLKSGSVIQLSTKFDLSSKSSANGDLVPLETAADLLVDGHIVIPKGSAATGQIFGARSTGGLGLSGKLELRALFLRYNSQTVRLDGKATNRGATNVGTALGVALISPVISGSSAKLKAGTPIQGIVLRDVVLPIVR